LCLKLNKTFYFKRETLLLEVEQNRQFQAANMPTSAFNRLAEIAADQHGYVTQQDARATGIPATTVARMAERGALVRTSHGVYRVPLIPRGPLDEYMEATLWPHGVRGVLSHETALDLHKLSDVSPAKIHITVPRGHRPQRRTPLLYVVHRADLPGPDVTALEGIPIVTPERAIRDAHAAGLGPALVGQAIDDGERRGIFDRVRAARLRSQMSGTESA
jgi:predicted transcriptional regulator of viral defense system